MSAVSASSAAAGSGRGAVPADPVRALQHALYRAAKADPGRRFHALQDKIYRRDVLWRAWVTVQRGCSYYCTFCIVSIGFLIASLVPTARFAQPIGAVIMYPMIAVSGLFTPIESLPPLFQGLARVVPLRYAVRLLEGIWSGDAWSAHVGDVTALVLVFAVCTALSAKVFRWE